MRILVTGGAGYIGSILVRHLLNQNHQVTVLDSFMFGQAPFNDLCCLHSFDVERGDVRDYRLVKGLMSKCDLIIPLAALVGAPICDADPTAAMSTNLVAVRNIMASKSKDQRVIFPNTNSGYGTGPGEECTEKTPLNPLSLYGRTKVDAEAAVLSQPNSITFRLATVFGMSPRMRLDLLVNDFVYRAINDRAVVLFEAHFKRNYIHVADVARAFEHAIENFDDMAGEPYNVGLSNANLSKRELCERIKSHVPRFTYAEAAIGEDPDKRDYIVSNAKIEATGFSPMFSLDIGIEELIRGYRMIRNTRYGNV